MSNTSNQYLPDLVTPPGEILLEKLEELGMSQTELANRIGRTKKMVNEIIKGKAPILSETRPPVGARALHPRPFLVKP